MAAISIRMTLFRVQAQKLNMTCLPARFTASSTGPSLGITSRFAFFALTLVCQRREHWNVRAGALDSKGEHTSWCVRLEEGNTQTGALDSEGWEAYKLWVRLRGMGNTPRAVR